MSRVNARSSPARGYKFGCVCSYMAGQEDARVVTGHIGTNTPKFVPPRWGRPRVDPTQTGLCKSGWVWSSLRESGSPELLGSSRASPEVPRTSPEVFRRLPRKFSHCGTYQQSRGSPEVSQTSPELPRTSPEVSRTSPEVSPFSGKPDTLS